MDWQAKVYKEELYLKYIQRQLVKALTIKDFLQLKHDQDSAKSRLRYAYHMLHTVAHATENRELNPP